VDADGKQGSAFIEVAVPDFAKEALSLSGLTLTRAAAPSPAGKEVLADALPVVPTTVREFSKADRVTAFMRVFQGGKGALASVQLVTTLVDEIQRTLVNQSDTLAAARFGTARAADVTFELPLARLAPGQYLFTFDATIGERHASRHVRFTLK
jgi:hypothetical protein